jgi:hypothetical protein
MRQTIKAHLRQSRFRVIRLGKGLRIARKSQHLVQFGALERDEILGYLHRWLSLGCREKVWLGC